MIQRIFTLIVLLCLVTVSAYATHNRAGEITYRQLDDLVIEATITTWTKTSSQDVDRDSLQLFWGDGTSSWVLRVNGGGEGEALENDVKKNLYTTTHTYPGRGTYTMFMFDPNRNGGILNVSFPNSLNVPFYVESTFTLLNTQFQGFNNSVQLLQPPVDVGCVGEIFIHNPNGFDPDEDSLSYELVIPLQDSGMVVPLYEFPDQVSPGASNQISLDPETGTFTWRSPQRAGEYNIAIEISEWRNGRLINKTRRDMQILILACDNQPPEVVVEDQFCVVAGELLDIPFLVTDPNDGQQVRVTALGGPFIADRSPATLNVPAGFTDPPVTGSIQWQTTCDHLSDQFYTIVLKATDNFLDSTGLSTLQLIQVKVIAASPEDLTVERVSDQIALEWISPYPCDTSVMNPEFVGFTVYRRNGSLDLERDTCNPGLENMGYEPIQFGVDNRVIDRYRYVDESAEKGISYCYRVVGEFGQISPGNIPFNLFESLFSDERCIFLSRGLPILLNVDVENTDLTSGVIDIRWANPLLSDLDTIEHPGPYRYVLERAVGQNGTDFTPIADSEINFLQWGPERPDSTFTDIGIDTEELQFNYRVAFYVDGNFNEVFCYSPTASSVRLSAGSGDRAVSLSWSESVPWQNMDYIIERQNTTGDFDSITITSVPFYVDRGLVNNREYCYRIQARGSYSVDDLPDPLINFSQEACIITMDTTGPCQLSLTLSNPCSDGVGVDPTELLNELNWNNPIQDCEESDDAIAYRVYFGETVGSELQLIETINDLRITEFLHQGPNGLAGCYAVAAVDSVGNEGELSEIICTENCPTLDIPNTFTPNGDGDNEVFRLRNSLFIDDLEIHIFTTWGEQIFTATGVDFRWDGTLRSGKQAATGTYYYVCRYTEFTVSDTPEEKELTGYIHLFR